MYSQVWRPHCLNLWMAHLTMALVCQFASDHVFALFFRDWCLTCANGSLKIYLLHLLDFAALTIHLVSGGEWLCHNHLSQGETQNFCKRPHHYGQHRTKSSLYPSCIRDQLLAINFKISTHLATWCENTTCSYICSIASPCMQIGGSLSSKRQPEYKYRKHDSYFWRVWRECVAFTGVR